MADFGRSDDLRGARFDHTDLRGARFVAADLSGVVMRSVEVAGLEIDTPWLLDGDGVSLLVNGVDVAPLVDAELNRRFPGRQLQRAADPQGLRAAWTAVQGTWSRTLDRAAALPAGVVDVSVAGEWSFAQTLRHLVLATDTWLGRTIERRESPYHPLGLVFTGAERLGFDLSPFTTGTPAYAAVLEARAERVDMVGDYLGTVTADELSTTRPNPWAPEHEVTVLDCLQTILQEEWEHHRYAVRDLDTLDAPGVTAPR